MKKITQGTVARALFYRKPELFTKIMKMDECDKTFREMCEDVIRKLMATNKEYMEYQNMGELDNVGPKKFDGKKVPIDFDRPVYGLDPNSNEGLAWNSLFRTIGIDAMWLTEVNRLDNLNNNFTKNADIDNQES